MKAWRISTHGGNEVLERVDLPSAPLKNSEVRVRVRAVGLNHLDLWVRKGVPGHRFPLPLIPGTDSVGTIQELSPDLLSSKSNTLKIGQRVLVAPGVSCGSCEFCSSDQDPLCSSYGILGETRDGGCADEIVVPARNILPLPDSIPFELAAGIGIPYLTAWSMVVRKANLKPGETILIQAGGSGVSVAATQIARSIGATVITTVTDPSKVAPSLSAGAQYVICLKSQNFRDELKSILKSLGKRGVEVAIDHVGKSTFNDSLRSLTKGGRLATCGATTGGEVEIDLKAVFFKNLSILGTTMGALNDLKKVIEKVKVKELKPVISQTFPMENLGDALDLIESRKVFGKVVLTQGE